MERVVDAARYSDDFAGDTRVLRDELHRMAEERSRLRLDVEMELTAGAGI
ncbi:MAG: hypothetical protein KY475_19160 [Planctomycetes bacterium]|nr:hypothetical protein [Planctomycetota bacterium]